MHTIGKYTKRTSKFNFLSKQTSQGKDYPLLGAGFAKFTADYYCTTLPLWCVYLRLHIKISYAEVKIATHSMSWEIRLLLTPFFLNVLALFKSLVLGAVSSQSIQQQLSPSRQGVWGLPALEAKDAPKVQGLSAESN